jgi:charged multivesicular body protein 2B
MGNKSTKQAEITPEEMKKSKRLIERASRKMDRERKKIEREQDKAKKEIAKLAKKGMHKPAKIMARDVAKLNSQIEQTYMLQSQLKTISFQLTQAMTTKEMSGILGISAETLSAVNENMDIKSIMDVCKDFAKNSDMLESKGEALTDAMEMVGDPGLDADADKLYQQALDDQALEINNDGIAVPKKEFAKEEVDEEKDDLESRLAALGK